MTVAVRARWWPLALVVLAHAVFLMGFGLDVERRHPGSGGEIWLVGGAVSTASFAAGLLARRSLRTRDGRRLRVRLLKLENLQLRGVERDRLAVDLQLVVTSGLAGIEECVATATRHPSDSAKLSEGLADVDGRCRLLLTELRILLDVLHGEPAPGVAAQARRSLRWTGLRSNRHVRIASTAVLVLLAGRVALGGRGPSAPSDELVLTIGLAACAIGVWRPRVGAAWAVSALVVSILVQAGGLSDLLPSALLCLMAAYRYGASRLWLVALALVGYGGLLALSDSPDPVGHAVVIGYAGLATAAVGLAARHFGQDREESLRHLGDLMDERGRVQTEERGALARELHDVVAHQLSVTTMLVMGTSSSTDLRTLSDALVKVRRSTEVALLELDTLVQAMRGTGTRPLHPTPLATPTDTADALSRRLLDRGFHPVLDIDPAAEAVDATTQRTLSRVMQEATTNILRYAPAGSACDFTLAFDEADVRLCVSSPLTASECTSDLSLGWGLRGIRERVDLMHGTFSAGPRAGHWVLTVTMPFGVIEGAVLRGRSSVPVEAQDTPGPAV